MDDNKEEAFFALHELDSCTARCEAIQGDAASVIAGSEGDSLILV